MVLNSRSSCVCVVIDKVHEKGVTLLPLSKNIVFVVIDVIVPSEVSHS